MNVADRHDQDHENETRPMQRKTVLLVRSGHAAGAAGLHGILMGMPDVRIVAEVHDAERAIAATRTYHQSHTLVGATEIDHACHDWLVELKHTGSQSKLIICTDALEQDMELKLGRIPIDGYLAWRNVSAENLRRGMELAEEGIRFASGAAVDSLVAEEASGEREHIDLTAQERDLLRRLVVGQTEKEIAPAMNLGVKTVERLIAGIKHRLDAPTLCAVGARAVAL
ncbi:MAG: LuxR C-terminal-related transcriptional regulator, partial [Chloroflexota bacterium]|nr:LuxR C-terminal-related transcriptional regulator [Chloroflexota bacterium]